MRSVVVRVVASGRVRVCVLFLFVVDDRPGSREVRSVVRRAVATPAVEPPDASSGRTSAPSPSPSSAGLPVLLLLMRTPRGGLASDIPFARRAARLEGTQPVGSPTSRPKSSTACATAAGAILHLRVHSRPAPPPRRRNQNRKPEPEREPEPEGPAAGTPAEEGPPTTVVILVPVLRGIRWRVLVFVARGALGARGRGRRRGGDGGRPERRRRPEQLGARLGGARCRLHPGAARRETPPFPERGRRESTRPRVAAPRRGASRRTRPRGASRPGRPASRRRGRGRASGYPPTSPRARRTRGARGDAKTAGTRRIGEDGHLEDGDGGLRGGGVGGGGVEGGGGDGGAPPPPRRRRRRRWRARRRGRGGGVPHRDEGEGVVEHGRGRRGTALGGRRRVFSEAVLARLPARGETPTRRRRGRRRTGRRAPARAFARPGARRASGGRRRRTSRTRSRRTTRRGVGVRGGGGVLRGGRRRGRRIDSSSGERTTEASHAAGAGGAGAAAASASANARAARRCVRATRRGAIADDRGAARGDVPGAGRDCRRTIRAFSSFFQVL